VARLGTVHAADDTPASDADVVVLVRRAEGVPLPSRARPGDAGLDLVTTEAVVLGPGRRATVGTGLAVALPAGTAGFVLPRSGLAARHGVTVLNAPGTVDAGYRGEVRVTLLNTDPTDTVELAAGERVAQLVVLELPTVRLVEVERLPGSARGEDGFGSTGRGPLDPGDPPAPIANPSTGGDT
jgi:dUTP pyrophosphatase